MKKLMFIWIAIISCSSIHSSDALKKSICNKLKSELKVNWKYSVDKGYFETNNTFIKRLDSEFKDCLLNLNQEQIQTLFGKPSVSHNNKNVNDNFKYSLNYLTTPPCKNVGENDRCSFLVFYFKSDLTMFKFNEEAQMSIISY